MEEEQEYNSQTYELNQDGRDFILTTGLVNDNLRVTCRDHLELTGPYFMGEYSLSELSSIHKYFLLSESIESAQSEINKAIERQKCGVIEQGNILKLIIYLIIGTDKSNLTLKLNKQSGPYKNLKFEEEPKYIGKLNLENKGNYPKDEQRIINLEQSATIFRDEQQQLHAQLEDLIEESMKLLNETYVLKEDNAKLNERIKLLSNDNNYRKNEIIKLRNEDRALKGENIKLNNDLNNLEKLLRKKKEVNIKDLEENNRRTQLYQHTIDSSSGPIARTTKFEKSQIQTFVPRTTIMPTGQTYTGKQDNTGEKLPFKTFTIKHA